jgi:hypothetical protein
MEFKTRYEENVSFLQLIMKQITNRLSRVFHLLL